MSRTDGTMNTYSRTKECGDCGRAIIVVRHPDDTMKPAKELKTCDIRLIPIHRSDIGDLVEAATTKREFNQIVSTFICDKRLPPNLGQLHIHSADCWVNGYAVCGYIQFI